MSLTGGADGARLLEQGFGAVGIVLQAADALQVPEIPQADRAGRTLRPDRNTRRDAGLGGRWRAPPRCAGACPETPRAES